jgi:hypothetical protein
MTQADKLRAAARTATQQATAPAVLMMRKSAGT